MQSLAYSISTLFSMFQWARQYAGGTWYLIRSEMHPATEEWRRNPPTDRVYDSLLKVERY